MRAWVVTVGVGLLTACGVPDAHATFHLMQVEQVIGGVDGDTNAQAIQLRMRASFQNLVGNARLVAWDAAGANPVVVIDFPASVPNHGLGVRVLVASADMAGVTDPPVAADFTMTNLIPPSYMADGSITFEDSGGLIVYWRLSWGNYTGSTTGAVTNDMDGEFGPPFNGPLPSAGKQALLFQGSAAALSTSNLFDYALTSGDAVLTNNAAESFTVSMATDASPAFRVLRLHNRPNPFNPATEIVFSTSRAGRVTLGIYDLKGRIVTTLLRGVVPAGATRVVWGGRDAEGRSVRSGVYVARLMSENGVETHKLLLVK